MPPVDEGHEGQGHADGGRREAGVVAVVVLEPSGHQRGEEGADVHGHVEQLEAAVAPRVVIVVEAADDRGQVRLDEPRPDGDADDPDPRQGRPGDRQADVAGHDDEAAVEGGQPRADDTVGEDAAGDRQEIDGGAVGGEDDLAGVVAQAEAAVGEGIGDEVEQDGAHPVVGEALPHLDVQHPRQSVGVAEEDAAVLPGRAGAQGRRRPSGCDGRPALCRRGGGLGRHGCLLEGVRRRGGSRLVGKSRRAATSDR